jgi:hypothetical protein
MRLSLTTNIAVLGLLLLVKPALAADPAAQTQQLFGVSDIITAIKSEIKRAQASETGSPRLSVDLVELQLNTVAVKTADGKITVGVPTIGFEIGGSGSSTIAQQLHVSLTSQEPAEIGASQSLGLVEVITELKNALRSTMNEPPRFDFQQLRYQVEFEVEKQIGGRVSFVVDVSGATSQVLKHQITFFLSRAR